MSRTNSRVICVGASNQDNTFSYFSNYNPDIVNIAAPGVAIYSTIQENSYEYQQGTSMATPMVAASLGVLKSYRPDLNPEEIITALYQGADQLSNLDAKVKSGRKLNLYESMKTIDKVPPQVTGTGDTQQWCSSGLINYTISAKDDLVDTGILYSFDQGKSWSSTDSIITGTSSLSGLVKDRKGNETQLSIFPVIPVCLSGSLMLEKTAVKNEMITLKISTTTGFFYEISGDIAEIKTGFFNTGEDISVALSVGTGEKKLSWIAFLSGHKSIVGSGKVMVDKTSPQIIIKNPHSNVTTTDTEILLAGQVFDNHRIKKLVINGVNIAVE